MNRRGFLSSILAAGVAPFVVRAESLMAVRVPASGLIVPRCSPIEPAFINVAADNELAATVFDGMAAQLGRRMGLVREMVARSAILKQPMPSSGCPKVEIRQYGYAKELDLPALDPIRRYGARAFL